MFPVMSESLWNLRQKEQVIRTQTPNTEVISFYIKTGANSVEYY